MNKIIGSIGKLGVGKTMWGIIWLYDGYCQLANLAHQLDMELPIASNLRVNFPHTPLKDFEEIAMQNFKPFYEATGRNGRELLDELWKLADNRKCMDAVTELMDIILLASRKFHIDIYYTQQFLQIDPRIAFITNEWIAPQVYPINPTKYNPPQWLVVKRYDADFNELPTQKIYVAPYLNLYDSDQNPYMIEKMTSPESIKLLINRIKKKNGQIE